MPDAILGTTVEIPTLSGKVKVKIEAGTPSGKILRLKGKGLPDINRYGNGDLLVKVNVWIPKNLNREENSINYIDSYTNFITFLFDDDISSNEISEILLKKGIIIRNLASYDVNGIRVTIGTSKQNNKFLQEFKKLVK
jgi:DnaJ-class molecular chaperone